MKRRAAFSLTELLLSLTLLAMGITIAFGIFDFGIHGFRISIMRQSLQSEARSAMALLEHDVRMGCLDATKADTTNARSPLEPRHALCVPGLNDYEFYGNFRDDGEPTYNRYFLYYTTLGDPGELYRVAIEPGGAPSTPPKPWKEFPSDFGIPPWSIGPITLTDLPGAVPPLELRKLSSHVSGFNVTIPGNTCVVAQLTLRGKTSLAGQKARDEIIQLNLYTPVYTTHSDPNDTP